MFVFNVSAIALAPSFPTWLTVKQGYNIEMNVQRIIYFELRSSSVTEVFFFSASAIALNPLTPILFHVLGNKKDGLE